MKGRGGYREKMGKRGTNIKRRGKTWERKRKGGVKREVIWEKKRRKERKGDEQKG